MIAFVLIALPVLTAAVLAATLQLDSLTATAMAGYVSLQLEIAGLVTVLSPLHAVTRGGIAAGEATLAVLVGAVWLVCGKPRPRTRGVSSSVRRIASDPVSAALAVVVAVALAYELLLVLTAPPTNADSLDYHLVRVIAWAQHGGIYWVPNAPTDRINEFQPLAEAQILFFYVVTKSAHVFALPQYLAELAILIGVYGSARRLRFSPEASAFASLLFATFAIVALEATTPQNDLVAASFAAASAFFLLTGQGREAAIAGAAFGTGLGVKLTVALVLPIFLALAARAGRRAFSSFAAGSCVAFAAVGAWGYVRNLVETGHLLGNGGGRKGIETGPSAEGAVTTVYRMLYRLLDLSGYSRTTVAAAALAGLLGGAVALGVLRRRQGRWTRSTVVRAAAVALPFLAPALVIPVTAVARIAAQAVGLPVFAPAYTFGVWYWGRNDLASEDVSYFGPIGGIALILVCAVVIARARRVDRRLVLLASAVPCFILLLALTSKYDPWLGRFLTVAVAITAPLLALIHQRRATAAATVCMAAFGLLLVHAKNVQKPARHVAHPPWAATQVQAFDESYWARSQVGPSTETLWRILGDIRCIGAAVDDQAPTFLFFEPKLDRRVVYLSRRDPVQEARSDRLAYVVVRGAAELRPFRTAGWRIRRAGVYWLVATPPTGVRGACSARGAS